MCCNCDVLTPDSLHPCELTWSPLITQVLGLISPVPTTSSANVPFCGQSHLTSSVSLPIATVNKRGFSQQSFLHLELLCHSFTSRVPHSSNRCPGPFYSLSQTVDMMACKAVFPVTGALSCPWPSGRVHPGQVTCSSQNHHAKTRKPLTRNCVLLIHLLPHMHVMHVARLPGENPDIHGENIHGLRAQNLQSQIWLLLIHLHHCFSHADPLHVLPSLSLCLADFFKSLSPSLLSNLAGHHKTSIVFPTFTFPVLLRFKMYFIYPHGEIEL